MATLDKATQGFRRFPTTRWTIVSAAGSHSCDSAEALNELCAAYWFPVYAFIRRKGYTREAAEDLSQDFFARLVEHETLSGVRRERGKFRSFLLTSVTNFLANEWDRSQAQKRGGGAPILSLDFDAGEARYDREPLHECTPEALFERQWAVAVLERVLVRLCEEYSRRGQAEQFDRLQVFLTGDQDHGSYAEVAGRLGLSEGAVRTAVHRLRRRYAALARDEVQGIVGDPGEVDGEIRFLLAAILHE